MHQQARTLNLTQFDRTKDRFGPVKRGDWFVPGAPAGGASYAILAAYDASEHFGERLIVSPATGALPQGDGDPRQLELMAHAI